MGRLGDKVQCNPTVKLTKGVLYPFFSMEKITHGYKNITSSECESYVGQSCSKFCKGDTIMARITPCLENGKIAQYNLDSHLAMGSTELFTFRGIENVTDNDYVFYLISTNYVRSNAINSMTGASGRQRADIEFIKKIKWEFPEYDTQCKIGKILSAYDDLIENNNKRIELLENMAQELYKEWFVRFRFPGHKTAKFENGIPEGWEVKRIISFGEVETGKTPSTEKSENYGNEIMFIKTPDILGNIFIIETEEMLSNIGHHTQPKKLIPANSIIVTCIGTGGLVTINAEPSHTNQQINSIKLYNQEYLEWLFYACKGLKDVIELYGATGTTMTNLSKGKFERLKILKPTNRLINEYHEKTKQIFSLIKTLMLNNKTLRTQRDLLLPRLMSGKLEV